MASRREEERGEWIDLSEPRGRAGLSVEEALRQRRSVREYTREPLTLEEVGQLLWAAQGITGARGERTAPSAGALYPLEIYLVAGDVGGLASGILHYRPARGGLVRITDGDRRAALCDAALEQSCVRMAPAILVIAAVYDRTTGKYGQRGIPYVQMEVGAVAENVYLQAESLGLGAVVVGAFRVEAVRSLLALPASQEPLALLPVGRRS